MFETSEPNGAAIAAFAAVERPLRQFIDRRRAKLIPNYTDVVVFRARDTGWRS